MPSLWGPEFDVAPKEEKQKVKQVAAKIQKPAKVSTQKAAPAKTLPLSERLRVIYAEVNRILGVYKDNTQVIYTVDDLHNYIDAAIKNNIVAIDTETNNSLDPVTCKLMGLCLYTYGQKNAYVPVNHTTLDGVRLTNQVTELDIKNELERLGSCITVLHNGKFDYEVLQCTCDVKINITHDSLIGAKVLDENELSAGLKQQYIEKIDPSIEKYSIEHLFKDVDYAVVDPEIFALYAATDSYMTIKLQEYQKQRLESPDLSRVYGMYQNVEMPLVPVIAGMELRGMLIDQEYAARLSKKHHKMLDDIDAKLEVELSKLSGKIAQQRATPDANYHPPKKTGEGLSKSKSEQLTDPINIGSPTQLAILFYDVLGAPVVNKKSPRGTGEEEIKTIAEKLKLPICDLILKRREQTKLLSTYIDAIPELAKRQPDGRVRTHFNQYGAATGRLSSSEPLNFQNIPSHVKSVRMLFTADSKEHQIEYTDCYSVNTFDEVLVDENTWIKATQLKVGDKIRNSLGEFDVVKSLKTQDNQILIYC